MEVDSVKIFAARKMIIYISSFFLLLIYETLCILLSTVWRDEFTNRNWFGHIWHRNIERGISIDL